MFVIVNAGGGLTAANEVETGGGTYVVCVTTSVTVTMRGRTAAFAIWPARAAKRMSLVYILKMCDISVLEEQAFQTRGDFSCACVDTGNREKKIWEDWRRD
ncbi:hypothetical protein M8818_001728 [Zalaria obscura]|uniref:Uncharacterized protein n=1 Tax=Zalaria obscura TaxID=2024903 RepID=A0ACC3SK51_9PEZI